jgi:anthranilate synthase component 1
LMVVPTLEQFVERARRGNVVPVYAEILADMETPVSAFRKLEGWDHAFLLESVEGGDRIGRYSFVGGNPFLVMKTRGRQVEIRTPAGTEQRELGPGEDPLTVLKELLSAFRFVPDPELPPFCGGAVGYIGYDTVRFFERLPDNTVDDRELPDCYFVFTDTLLIFDRVQHRIKVLCNARVNGDPERAYREAVGRIEAVIGGLRRPFSSAPGWPRESRPVPVTATVDEAGYCEAVRRAKEYIAAGDCIQVVLSQRLAAEIHSRPFDLYRALRSLNPSPYMYFLQFEDCQIVGSSPEILVTERRGEVVTRPIAGTVRRGKTAEEDRELEAQLLADPKERAEHVMLVDLHRNDIGRVCEYGSVTVDELLVTEKYSHVIHIVSNVTGKLRKDRDAFDLLRASFPAGTLSGAPKIRAMEIIDELEPVRRGPYGGAIGYFSFSGDMDTAITIRTIVVQGRTAYMQAGAGIVADSVPENEYQECMNKLGALRRAVEMAEAGLE